MQLHYVRNSGLTVFALKLTVFAVKSSNVACQHGCSRFGSTRLPEQPTRYALLASQLSACVVTPAASTRSIESQSSVWWKTTRCKHTCRRPMPQSPCAMTSSQQCSGAIMHTTDVQPSLQWPAPRADRTQSRAPSQARSGGLPRIQTAQCRASQFECGPVHAHFQGTRRLQGAWRLHTSHKSLHEGTARGADVSSHRLNRESGRCRRKAS